MRSLPSPSCPHSTSWSTFAPGGIRPSPTPGGTAKVAVAGTDHPGPYALDGTNVYTTGYQRAGSQSITRLRVASLTGATSVPFTAGGWYGTGTPISFDADYLYFAHSAFTGGT